MVKAVDKHARITDVRVTAKSGGRSGDWAGVSRDLRRRSSSPARPGRRPASTPTAAARSSSRRCGEWGFDVDDPVVVPDGPEVEAALRAAVDAGVRRAS